MDQAKSLENQIKYIWKNIKGFHIIHYIYTGNELGLFNLIAKKGDSGISIEELASLKSLHLPYLTKWCFSGISWDILEEYNGNIKLCDHMEYLLTRPGDPRYLLPYVKSCIDHFGPDMKDHSKYYLSGKKYIFQEHGKKFSDDIGSITEGLQTLMVNKIIPDVKSLNERLIKGVNFLDFGCGTAKLLIKMAEKYPNSQYFGLDIDPSGIKIGNENINSNNKNSLITIINSNTDKLPSDESIDIISMVEVLHEIDKTIRLSVLQNISKLIKKDGYLIILDETMPEKNQLKEEKYNLSILTQYNEMTWGNEVPTEKEQNELMVKSGFSVPERKIIGGLFTLLICQKL